eukprot:1104982-Rhodomonas_salina.4
MRWDDSSKTEQKRKESLLESVCNSAHGVRRMLEVESESLQQQPEANSRGLARSLSQDAEGNAGGADAASSNDRV